MKKLVLLVAVGLMLTVGSFAFAATTDVREYPTTYFVNPVNWQNEYRYWDGDWGWTHNAISETITSGATINIAAYDVDYADGERDAIYAWNSGTKTFLGYLEGSNNTWAYTKFTLGAEFYDDIAAGLQVYMDIDTTHNYNYWAVSLSKSALEVNGGELPNPNPNPTPEPLTMLLLGLGLTGIAGVRRFKK